VVLSLSVVALLLQGVAVLLVVLPLEAFSAFLLLPCHSLVLPSGQELRNLQEYRLTAEEYGIMLVIRTMQYVTMKEAVVRVVDYLDADTVFARLPRSFIPWWHDLQRYSIKQQLAAYQRRLSMVDSSYQGRFS
jgi:hypothetical protein